jgi:hypothetical protein
MVLPLIPLITASPNRPNILGHQDGGGAELHLSELPFNRGPRTSAKRRSKKFGAF